jgi:hypothetical protein
MLGVITPSTVQPAIKEHKMGLLRNNRQVVARLAVAMGLASASLVFQPTLPAQADALVVDRADDAMVLACTANANDCTLRGAIQVANTNGVSDNITFHSSYAITLTGGSLNLTVAGTTITATPAQTVTINGNNASQVFAITASDSTLDGLRLSGAPTGTAIIHITGMAARLRIARSIIGDDDLGLLGTCGNSPYSHSGIFINSTAAPSGSEAVAWIYGTVIKCIGGLPGHGLMVSGADKVIVGADSAGNAGAAQLTISAFNDGDGVFLFNGANNNVIRNSALQYNLGNGLNIYGSSHNQAYGSFFQVNTLNGVQLTNGAFLNQIGCPLGNSNPNSASVLNRIVDNGQHGIYITGAGSDSNTVLCNQIGLDSDGSEADNGGDGVNIGQTASFNLIGIGPGTRNVISGNTANGVHITGTNTRNNQVRGNYIGTNQAGTSAVSNVAAGVTIDGGAALNTVGGTTVAEGNLIGGNNDFGVVIAGNTTTTNTVTFNDIGVNSATAFLPVPNAEAGVLMENGTRGNIIGGIGRANNIAFNDGHGIYLLSSATLNQVLTNQVYNNAFAGVTLDGSNTSFNVISSTVIYNNGSDGINERNSAGLNVWQHLSVYGNNGLGIDRLANVLNSNSHDGPFPMNIVANDVTGVITGTATNNAIIEVYRSGLDPSGYGEGKIYVGTTISNGSGQWSLSVAPGTGGCYTAFQTTGLIVFASSEFGPSNCRLRLFVPLTRR